MNEDLPQASNPNTQETREQALARARGKDPGKDLWEGEDEEVRRAVALNLSAPPEALLALAKDPSAKVRVCVAYNPKTPKEALLELAHDPKAEVRMGVAHNPNAPLEALLRLGKDTHYWISEVAYRRLLLLLPELPKPKVDPSPWIRIREVLPKEDRIQLEAFEGMEMVTFLARLGGMD